MPESFIGNVLLSVKSSLMAITNFYFYKLGDSGDYWNPLLFRPLLHLWSLSVEEQFYFVFPLFFIIFIKKKKIFLLFLITLFIASISYASIIVLHNKKLAYYMPYSRAFALILGCLTAFININFSIHKKITLIFMEGIALLCIIFIILGCYFLLNTYNLPSYLTLIVILPTAILLALGKHHTSLVHKFLGNKLFYYIGLYSFSIYLVHFWLWSYYSYWASNIVSLSERIAIILASIILGAIQYYAIEQTFRYKNYSLSKALVLFFVIPFVIYFVIYKAQSIYYKQHLNTDVTKIIEGKNDIDNNNILLFGDSNALHYYATMQEIAKFMNFKFDTIGEHSGKNYDCLFLTKTCLNILKNYNVIILGHSYYFDFVRNGDEVTKTKNQQKQLTSLFKEAQKQGTIIVILGEIPKFQGYAQLSIFGKQFYNIKFNYNIYQNGILKNNQLIEKLTNKFNNVYYVDFNNLLLLNQQIIYYDKGYYTYYNASHLSEYGSTYVGNKYVEAGKIAPIFYKIKQLFRTH